MESIAIIAEFNPFHQGHKYLIDTLRKSYGNLPIVIIMSGSFVQRGEPAMFDKWHRAQWALSCGADLVIELPTAFAVSGAQGFASGGVSLAAAMGCTRLACGIEQGTASDLMLLASRAVELDIHEFLAKARKEGLTYGTALTRALTEVLPEQAELLRHPNALLALEYAKAVQLLAPDMVLETVPRASKHHGKVGNSTFLRQSMIGQTPRCVYEGAIPAAIREDLGECLDSGQYVDYSRYHDLILYQSRMKTGSELAALAAFSEGIENRWRDIVGTAGSWTAGLEALKTKRYPYSRLCRMAAYTVLDIEKNMMYEWLRTGPAYARILGMNGTGRAFVRAAIEKNDFPFITKITKANKVLTLSAQAMLDLDLRSTDIQYLCMKHVEWRLARQDYYQSPIIASY